MSVVTDICCQVEVSASDHSFGGLLHRVLCLSDISKLRETRGHDRNTVRSATNRKRKKYN